MLSIYKNANIICVIYYQYYVIAHYIETIKYIIITYIIITYIITYIVIFLYYKDIFIELEVKVIIFVKIHSFIYYFRCKLCNFYIVFLKLFL